MTKIRSSDRSLYSSLRNKRSVISGEASFIFSLSDAENKESLSKNGITHILSVYNNAKPVFEVSGKSVLAGPNCLNFPLKFLPGNSEDDCAY